MTAFGRASDLLWVHFGEMRRVSTYKKGWKFVGEYALHLQCPWRLTQREKLVTGRGDIFERRGEAKSVLFDSRVRKVPLRRLRLIVAAVEADAFGGFRLGFSRGWRLEAFPMESMRSPDSEWWRMFIPSGDSRHFVVTSAGIQL